MRKVRAVAGLGGPFVGDEAGARGMLAVHRVMHTLVSCAPSLTSNPQLNASEYDMRVSRRRNARYEDWVSAGVLQNRPRIQMNSNRDTIKDEAKPRMRETQPGIVFLCATCGCQGHLM